MKRYYYSRTKVDGMYRVYDRKLALWIAACPYKEAAHQVVEALNVPYRVTEETVADSHYEKRAADVLNEDFRS